MQERKEKEEGEIQNKGRDDISLSHGQEIQTEATEWVRKWMRQNKGETKNKGLSKKGRGGDKENGRNARRRRGRGDTWEKIKRRQNKVREEGRGEERQETGDSRESAMSPGCLCLLWQGQVEADSRTFTESQLNKEGIEGWKWAEREEQKKEGDSETKCQSPNGCQAFCSLPSQSCSTMWWISSIDQTAAIDLTTSLFIYFKHYFSNDHSIISTGTSWLNGELGCTTNLSWLIY